MPMKLRKGFLKEKLIREFHNYGIFSFYDEPIKLSSGKLSDFYIDMRKAAGIPFIFKNITRLVAHEFLEKDYDLIIGLEYYGAVYAHSIGCEADIPSAGLRKKAKEHGRKQQLEGNIGEDKELTIILMDDVATSGNSLIKGIKDLRDLGYEVNNVYVLVDREEGAREALEYEDVKLDSLFTKKDLLGFIKNN